MYLKFGKLLRPLQYKARGFSASMEDSTDPLNAGLYQTTGYRQQSSNLKGPKRPHEHKTPTNQGDSGIPLVSGLRTRPQDPWAEVVSAAPRPLAPLLCVLVPTPAATLDDQRILWTLRICPCNHGCTSPVPGCPLPRGLRKASAPGSIQESDMSSSN